MIRGRWILLAACAPAAACFVEQGSGNPATETLDLPAFEALRVTNQVDVELDEGDAVAGELTCDDNLLDNIRIEVRNRTLVIDNPVNQGFRPRTDCFATITSVGLEAVEATGSGDIAAADFLALDSIRTTGSGSIVVRSTDARTLDVEVTGSGGVDVAEASGAADVSTTVTGSGNVSVARIDAELVDVAVTASGDATLEGLADDLLISSSGSGDVDAGDLAAIDVDVNLSGSGSATVDASRSVTGRISGSGDLIVRGDAVVDVRTTGSGDVR